MICQTKTYEVCSDKFKGKKVIEVHNSKILNVAQMSQLMKIKVKYVQGHLYIVILEIYRWYQAAIPTFDILIGFEVITERLNPDDEIFRVLFFSTLLPPPPPHKQQF